MSERVASVRAYRAGDEVQILEAFNRVNRELWPGFRERRIEAWRWRYLENPAGQRISLALDEAGRVLAQYAGTPQRLQLDGVPLHITQGIDSFSIPESRALGRSGSFVRAGEHFAESFGGRTDGGDPWMWGFPVPSARRVGERFLGYTAMRSQPVLEFVAQRAVESGAIATDIETESWQASAHEIQELFLRRGEGPTVMADRRAQALDWRYRRHPEHRYRLGLARDSAGDLQGLAVWRAGEFEGREVGLICDWLCEPQAEAALLRWALAHTREAGLDCLLHLLSPHSASFESLQSLGFRARPSSLLMVGRSYDRAYPVSFWSEHWHYTLGDTDLV